MREVSRPQGVGPRDLEGQKHFDRAAVSLTLSLEA